MAPHDLRAPPRQAMSRALSTERRAGHLARQLLRAATRPLAKRSPIERCPGWLGTLHNLNVPNNVLPNVREEARGGANVRIVFRLLESALSLEGDVAECGVYQGSTLIPIGLFVRQRRSPKRVLGFDSFAGLDETVKVDIGLVRADDPEKKPGGFSHTSYGTLVDTIRQFDLESTVTPVRGYFQDTLVRYSDRRFRFSALPHGGFQMYQGGGRVLLSHPRGRR